MDVSKLYELGATLKAHRESRELVREDIALRIKISAKNLHAIEEGLLDKLPQPIFTRSFIRSYAQAMEMDLAEIDRRLAEVFPSSAIDNIKPDLTTSARELSVGINTQPTGKKPLVVIVLLVLALLAGGAWFYLRSGEGADTGRVPAPVRQNTDAEQVPAPEQRDAGSTGQPQDQARQEAGTEQARNPVQPDADAGQAPAPEQMDAGAQAPERQDAVPADAARQNSQPAADVAGGITSGNTVTQSNASVTSGISAGEHRVIVSGISGECWVGAKFDDIGERNVNLTAGRHFVLDFKERLTITLGNAAAVRVSYNGRPVDYSAADGDVRVLRFPR